MVNGKINIHHILKAVFFTQPVEYSVTVNKIMVKFKEEVKIFENEYHHFSSE